MNKKVVRGLLDSCALKDDEIEFERPSENFMYGMGSGATPEATRWAYIGYKFEQLISVELSHDDDLDRMLQPTKKSRGGQPKLPRNTNDAKRALVLYATIERIREVKKINRESEIEFPLYELICLTEQLFSTYDIFKKPADRNKMRASVKRGRQIWGIDDYWRGPDFSNLFEY